jgi:hypothetical protein
MVESWTSGRPTPEIAAWQLRLSQPGSDRRKVGGGSAGSDGRQRRVQGATCEAWAF